MEEMGDPHICYHLLRLSANASRLMYTLRSTPPHTTLPICQSFDKGMRRVFEATHGVLNDQCWHSATTMLRDGGLGLRPTCLIAGAAYTGSTLATLHLITGILPTISFPVINTVSQALDKTLTLTPLEPTPNAPDLVQRTHRTGYASGIQHELTERILEATAKQVQPANRDRPQDAIRRRRRLESISTPNARRPFSTLPTPDT